MSEEINQQVEQVLLPCPWHPHSAVNMKFQGERRHWAQCYGGCRGPACSSYGEAIDAWNLRPKRNELLALLDEATAFFPARQPDAGALHGEMVEAALRECQDKLWLARCDSKDPGFREAAENACDMARDALRALPAQEEEAEALEIAKAAEWKDGLAEAYRVLIASQTALELEHDRNTHLKGVYEPVKAALWPAIAEVGELIRRRAVSSPPAILAECREVLEKIVEVGTRTITERIGDMYDPINGYADYEKVSEEAQIASALLAKLGDRA